MNHRAFGAELHANHIAIVQAGGRHLLLALAHGFDGADGVTQLRGFLEALGDRGAGHPLAQLHAELLGAAFEKEPRVGHRRGVAFFRADGRHARRQAAADVVFEARTGAESGNHLVARPDAEHLVGQGHGPARELRRQERAGEKVAPCLNVSGHQHPRKRFGGRQLQIRIVFVVAQQDVVARIALLDQVVLERQGLDDRVGDDDLEARGFVEQRVVARAEAVGAKVAADAIAQRSGLADVEGFSRGAGKQIDPGLMRQPAHLLLEIVDGH